MNRMELSSTSCTIRRAALPSFEYILEWGWSNLDLIILETAHVHSAEVHMPKEVGTDTYQTLQIR